MKLFSSLFFSLILSIAIFAQQDTIFNIQVIHYQDIDTFTTANQNEVKTFLNTYLNNNRLEGYLGITVDSLKENGNQLLFYVEKGKKYSFLEIDTLQYVQSDLEFQSISNFLQLKQNVSVIMRKLQDEGFPFSAVTISSNINNGIVQVACEIDKGPYIRLDSLVFLTKNLIHPSYIYNYLNYQPGEPYSETSFSEIGKAIDKTGIVKMSSPPSVIFKEEKAQIYLNFSKVNASRFDGIVGFQPADDGSTSITGLINISLHNGLKRGELIQLNWERLKAQNQRLKAVINTPYLLKTKAGLQFSAELIRQDSSLNRAQLKYDLFYDFSRKSRISFGISTTKNNSNINSDLNFMNTNNTSYTAAFSHKDLDYLLNPRKGLIIHIGGSVGNRVLAEQKSKLAGLHGSTEFYIPIRKKSVIKLFGMGESISSPGLFENELFQIGGLNSIRGVDQRSILSSSWITTGAEYRFLFEQNSSVFLFIETHFNEKNTVEIYQNKQINATGIGFNIGTKNGLFSFSYGLSDVIENRLLFRNAKINFGYTSTF